jgi:hypothetical protein
VLRELGGFPNGGVASDYLLWLKACALINTLLVPGDLFWYREHGGQELRKPEAAMHYAMAQAQAWKALFSPDCPLTGKELDRARCRRARDLLKVSWWDFRDRRWYLIPWRLRRAGFRVTDLLRYPPLVPLPRAGLAPEEMTPRSAPA